MDQTEWLQQRRMKKFMDVFGRWKEQQLSGAETTKLLGMSECSFGATGRASRTSPCSPRTS